MHEPSGQRPWSARAWLVSARTALLVLAGPAALLGGAAAGGTSGAAVVALGSFGSVVLVAAACAALGAVLVQVLFTGVPCRSALQRERTASRTAILRAQEPGRPGRPQPRAPGAARLPHPAP